MFVMFYVKEELSEDKEVLWNWWEIINFRKFIEIFVNGI
jgi:hypothetical protein